ncbi:hypothetical protein [Effusibacillus pohliae]|nr:hypothetical protein [Effusibacillus pohliae]
MASLWFDVIGSVAAALLLAGIPILLLQKFNRIEEQQLNDKETEGES